MRQGHLPAAHCPALRPGPADCGYDRDLLRVDHDVSRITLTYRRGRFSFPFHLMYRSETEFEADLGEDLVLGIGVQSSFSQW